MILLEGVAPTSDTIDLTDDSLDPRGTVTIGPVKIISVKKAEAPSRTIKTPVKRSGKIVGPVLDKVLPIVQDSGTGRQTIFGLPPFLVYLVGGVGVSFAGYYLMRKMGGGRRLAVANPKRRRKARRSKR